MSSRIGINGEVIRCFIRSLSGGSRQDLVMSSWSSMQPVIEISGHQPGMPADSESVDDKLSHEFRDFLVRIARLAQLRMNMSLRGDTVCLFGFSLVLLSFCAAATSLRLSQSM